MLVIIGTGVVVTRHLFNSSQKSSAVTTTATSSEPAHATAGGTLVEGDIGLPTTLNPLLATSQTERDLTKLMFNGLVRVDGSGTPQPDLADKWAVSSDGRTYTVTLKSGVTWQDGKPFTSQDVRFTIGLVQSPDFPGDPQLAQFWRPIVVDTPNDSTVVFHLMDPFSPFLNYLDLPILPKHVLGGTVAQDLATSPFNQSPIGTGPFSFSSFDSAKEEIKLKSYAGYFGQKPHLAGVTIRYFSDTDKLLAALNDGSVDSTGSLPADQITRAGSLSSGDAIYAPLEMSYTALYFNTRVAPFSDQTVRQALQLAIDPSVLSNGPLKTLAEIGSSPIPETSWAYSAQSVTSDPQQALSMLDKAGWKYVQKDDVLENGGTSFSFQLLVNGDDPERVLMAQTIAQQLGNIHIRVDVVTESSDAVSQSLASRQFSAAVFGGHYDNGDPDCLNVWHSSDATAGLNFTGISNSKFDELLQQARETTDVSQRKNLYAQFQQDFVAQAPAVVLYYPRYLFVVSSNVKGVSPDPIVDPSDRFAQIANWYLGNGTQPGSTP